eukprot:2115039-Pyramimonas_sp.AAC.1
MSNTGCAGWQNRWRQFELRGESVHSAAEWRALLSLLSRPEPQNEVTRRADKRPAIPTVRVFFKTRYVNKFRQPQNNA